MAGSEMEPGMEEDEVCGGGNVAAAPDAARLLPNPARPPEALLLVVDGGWLMW